MTAMTQQLLTTSEVADLLRVPQRSLDQWAYQGSGPAFVRVGRYRRYRPADLEAWLNERTTTTARRQ